VNKRQIDFMKEWVLLSPDIQRELRKAIEKPTAKNAGEFEWEILVGPCPKCGNQKTMDCEGIEGIDDPTVGLCKRCGFLWCTECGSALGASVNCDHWEVCGSCQISKDKDEDCGNSPTDCEIIQNWKFSRGRWEFESARDN
jgi:hypothetical protein